MRKKLVSLLTATQLMSAPAFLSFPQGFLWGASTSSHQVEGGTNNQWDAWENANAQHLADTAPSRLGNLANWDQIKAQATDPQNYIAGNASGEYDYTQDLDLAQRLGLTSYRFSLEWSRIEPSKGVFDEAAIQHYRDEIAAVKARGMVPFVTLWHWTSPTWFEWTDSDAVAAFGAYSSKVATELGQDTAFWVTVNEPEVYTGSSYLTGEWPPQGKNIFTYFSVMDKLAQAHKNAYAALHRANPMAQVGIAHPHTDFYAGDNWFASILKTVANYWYNWYFLDKITDQEDFVGVNFYQRADLSHAPFPFLTTHDSPVSDLGWELYPQGIYDAITETYDRYHKPIYVTENGLADATDTQRAGYITAIAQNIHQAINDGADVRGYSYWSLVDNFEWAYGKWPRFGLISLDYATGTKEIRPSAWTYADIIRQNGVTQ